MITKIKKPSANCTELHHANGDIVFYSYETPVAALKKGKYYRTEVYHSRTTSKHINNWIPDGVHYIKVPEEKLYAQDTK